MNILFITCSRIGDAVLTTPILRNIEETYSGAKVTIAADPLVAPLFKDYPLLDKLIFFKKKPRGGHWLGLWKDTWKTRWDLIIDLRGSAISYTLWTKQRRIWYVKGYDPRHKVTQICEVVRIPVGPTHVWFSSEKLNVAKALIQDDQSYLALSPAANWIGKQWPVDSFTRIAEKLLEQDTKAHIAVFCAPHEKDSIQLLLDRLPKERSLIFCDGRYDLAQVAALIQRCRLFLGNDSGLMHMAAAVGTPTIGLFGPSRENNYGPWGVSQPSPHSVVRIPLSYDELSKQPGFSHGATASYMDILHVDKVWAEVKEKWNQKKS